MHVRQAAFAVMLLASTVACGRSGASSPSAPSTLGGTAVTGATVQGQVMSGSPMLAATTGAGASGLTVTVVGTPISAAVSGTGRFVLTGVPAGSNQLNFSGPGVNVTVTFTPVQGTETISINVKISGSQAEVESEEHDNHGDLEIHGTISNLTGPAGSFSFMVGGKTVHGDAQTTFFGDGDRPDSFATLHNGARVEVKGAMRDGLVYAQRIHINGSSADADDGDDHEGDDDSDADHDGEDADKGEVSGTIAALTAGCPSISFIVSGTPISTNASTEFKGASCSALKNGDKVKVEGTKQPSGTVLATEVKKQ
jgi:hypothetical protein